MLAGRRRASGKKEKQKVRIDNVYSSHRPFLGIRSELSSFSSRDTSNATSKDEWNRKYSP